MDFQAVLNGFPESIQHCPLRMSIYQHAKRAGKCILGFVDFFGFPGLDFLLERVVKNVFSNVEGLYVHFVAKNEGV